MVACKTSEVIKQLKRIKEERGLSYQNIIDMVEETGGYTSMSTLRRVFAPDSETKNFRYDDSLKPIVVALLGINDPPAVGDDVSIEQHEFEALKTVIQLKEQINDNLVTENERLKSELLNAKADYNERLINFKEASKERHDILKTQLVQKDKWLILLAVLLFLVIMIAFAVLIYDIVSPNVGFVRHSNIDAAINQFSYSAKSAVNMLIS